MLRLPALNSGRRLTQGSKGSEYLSCLLNYILYSLRGVQAKIQGRQIYEIMEYIGVFLLAEQARLKLDSAARQVSTQCAYTK